MSKNLFILVLACLIVILFARVISTDARVVELLNLIEKCECVER